MRKKVFTNGLSKEQAELLAVLVEELGESQQAIGKILRHGYESRNPRDPNHAGNRFDLERELGNVLAAIELLWRSNDVQIGRICVHREVKLKLIGQYLHHAKVRP